jgi:hypothetical protein
MCDNDKFLSFYGNNKAKATCHGSNSLGASYVCPTPTIGGKGVKKTKLACGVETPNMGRLAYCASAQVGGGSTDGMMFTATGELGKKNSKCGCQKGGSHPRKHTKSNNPSLPNYSGDNTKLDFPRSSCNCRSSSYCDYKNNRGTPISGYYLDVSAPAVGNRAAHSTYNNMSQRTVGPDNGNLLNRKFDCQQPFWCEKCM